MNTFAFDPVKYFYRDSARPTISGKIAETDPKTKIEILIGATKAYADFDATTSRWKWTAPDDMADGSYSVSVTIIDAAGNRAVSILRTMIIDSTPPDAPELLNLHDGVGGITGSFDPGQKTDDSRPKLTGIAQPGTIVYLRDASGKDIGSAEANAVTGKWEMQPNLPLPVGENSLTLVAIEQFGADAKGDPVYRTGKSSDAFIINVGPADFITFDGAIDDAGKWTGALSSGALTDDTTPALHGTVSAGESVIVYFRKAGESSWSGSATATVSGENWDWTPSSAFTAGHYEFQARSAKSTSIVFDLDIFAAGSGDQQTRITQVWDDVGSSTGMLYNGDYTDDKAPEFTGRAEANSRVVIEYSQGATLHSVTVSVGSNGVWKWTPAADLATGDWKFQMKSEAATAWNSSFELHIYPSPLVPTTITQVFDDVGVTGLVGNNGITDDSTPTISGRSEAGRFVLIYDGSTMLGSAQTNSNGDWTFTSASLGDGRHNFWAVQRDYSGVSNKWLIDIDTSGLGPDKPSITGLLELQNSGAYDMFVNGGIIDNGSVKVEGNGRALSIINIYDGTTLIGSTTAGSDGKWSYLHASKYGSGFHSITATELKSAGTESDHSNQAKFTLVGSGNGDGSGLYVNNFHDDPEVINKNAFNAGHVFRIPTGGSLTLVSGFLYGKNQPMVKSEPGFLKTQDTDNGTGTPIVFKTAPTTDFYMSLVGLSDYGSASLLYYSTTGKYLGSTGFGSAIGANISGDIKATGFVAPEGELIGQVTLRWRDKGGVAIQSVGYGMSSLMATKGAAYFQQVANGQVYAPAAGEDFFRILTGVGYQNNGKMNLSNKEIFSFSVGQTTDIQFSTEVTVGVTFYDTYDNVIHVGQYNGYINYTAPAGQLIYRVAIDTYGQTNVNLDNVIWGNNLGTIDYGYDSKAANILAHDDSAVMLNGLAESAAIIDMQDGEATTKIITLEDLLTNGEESLFTEADAKQLMIQGDKDDVIQLKDIMPEGGDIEQWTHQKGTITVAGVEYDVYSHNGENAELLVQSDIKVEMI